MGVRPQPDLVSKLPLVSIVVPAFNAEATIRETVLSALAQTYRAIEVIVVDDGSSDATAAAVAAVAATDARLRLVRTGNGGPSRARNVGIAASSGAFIAPFDSDDLWHPEKIERQVEAALGAVEPPGFVYSFFHRIDGESCVIASEPPIACRGPVLNRLAYKAFVANGAALFSRSALLEAGGFDERLRHAEDHLLHLRVARNHPAEVVPEIHLGYRLRPGSLSYERDEAFAGLKMATRMFRAECHDVPAYVWKWAIGRRCFQLAESRALQGRFLSCLGFLAEALRLDPRRTFAHLAYRIHRVVRKRFRIKPAPVAEHAPAGDPYALAKGAERLRRLEERRFERLAALDAAWAARSW